MNAPVEIKDVLALLPEIFPGVQAIPLKRIYPNPENPGPPVSEEDIQSMVESILVDGLLDPAKLKPYPIEPPNGPGLLAPGVSLHPDNPRLKGDGTPWKVEDFNWMILTGELRWRALDRLQTQGWVWQGPPSPGLQPSYRLTHFDTTPEGAMPAFALNPTEEEAVVITHTDNDPRQRGWWAGYQSIEQLVKANPNQTQGQVAARLKMDRNKVTRAIGLLPLLNAASKALISRQSANSNKGIWGISEMATYQLAGLGPGTGLKPGVKAAGAESQKLWPYPAIPPETQDLIRRTLEVAIDRELTEAGVKGLVGHVQGGHQPEEFGQSQGEGTPSGEKASSGTGVAASSTPAYSAGTPRNDSENEDEETDGAGSPTEPAHPSHGLRLVASAQGEGEEDFKPIPWSENFNHPQYGVIPVNRIRLNRYIAIMYQSYLGLDRYVLAMKATQYASEISVRSLTADENAADPDHDYELFEGAHTLKAAQILGWPSLQAKVYPIDEMEAVRLHNLNRRLFSPLTWIEKYLWIADRVKEAPEKSAAQWAIETHDDQELVMRVLPVLKLINEPAMTAIAKSVHQCYRAGGYEFGPEFSLFLEPLKAFSKDLSKTQKMVEQVVGRAIEMELEEDDIEALVDWVLAGHDPNEFEVEAVVE